MAARGFGFLGWNTPFRGAEAYFLLDHASPRSVSVSAGCASRRESSGSCCSATPAGGSLMAAYQSQAVEPNIRAAPGLRLVDAALDLVPGDLYVAGRSSRPARRAHRVDGPVRRDRGRPGGHRSRPRHVRPGQRTAASSEFVARYRAAQEAQPADLRVARAELERADAEAVASGTSCLRSSARGRPAVRRPDHRLERPTHARLLPR